jgi:ribulose 1,5-bisphosphate carboxylase large subunit-like protein
MQAADVFSKGIPVDGYARDHYELERAIRNWGAT